MRRNLANYENMAVRHFTKIGALCLLLTCAGCPLTPDRVESTAVGGPNAVVFDIDGTLTPDVHAVFSVRKDAATAVNTFFRSGIKVIYLTGRVTLLQSVIPGWLDRHGFPEGSVHAARTREDHGDHAAFKQRVLEEYRNKGWTLIAAYGDSTTDFKAYEAAGIPRERVFALLRKGETECQPGYWRDCYAGWTEQLETIGSLAGGAD
jgi:hypothetical protein